MRDNRISAVDDGRVVPAFIEHAGVHTEYIGKIYCAVKSALVRADHDGVIFVDNKIFLCAQKRADELIGRRKIIEALDRDGILYSGIVGIECDEIGYAHIHQFFDGIGTV